MTMSVYLRLSLVVVAVASTAGTCVAAFTFLGPTPYLSSADSPFAGQVGAPDFYLEDFEDGELNTRGIISPARERDIMGPSTETDSVDADTGAIDGSGNGGFSLTEKSFVVLPTIPGTYVYSFRFQFDAAELGGCPISLASY